MPYDDRLDRSNYEKGGAEEFLVIRCTVQFSSEITQKATQRRREGPLSLIEDPSRGPQAHFFQSPSVTRIVATQSNNKTQLGCLGGCNRWPLIISNYILFYIAYNLWRR